MSLRLYPFSVRETDLRALAVIPASERCVIAKAGAGEIWPLSEEFSEAICRAAEQAFEDATPPERAGEAAVAAVVGLAVGGAKGERLAGEIEDWKAAALHDLASWAWPQRPLVAAVLSVLVTGRDLNGRPGPGAGEPRYTLLTQSETTVLANELTQLTENGGLESAGELNEFILDLLSWSEACSNEGCSLLLGIL